MTVYQLTKSFPQEEKFGLISQIRRAAVSIPANVAEGAGRQSEKEFAYFLSNAQGSASELSTELLIAHRLGYLSAQAYKAANEELNNIGRMLYGLIKRVEAQTPGGKAFRARG